VSLTWLKTSRALWARREQYRKARHTAALDARDEARIKKWGDKLREARKQVALRTWQIEQKTGPRIITSAQLGLRFQYVWGTKGNVFRGAGHYTAGKRASNAAELAAEMRADHAFHMGKGWGGLSYEAMVADDGTIGLGNPIDRKSAAVAATNTGMVSICCPGTTGDRMTEAQERSVRWLMDNWHTTRLPKAHRLSKPARSLAWHVHRDWPGQSTACPGVMKTDYEGIWR
jgi:hypothetical protein